MKYICYQKLKIFISPLFHYWKLSSKSTINHFTSLLFHYTNNNIIIAKENYNNNKDDDQHSTTINIIIIIFIHTIRYNNNTQTFQSVMNNKWTAKRTNSEIVTNLHKKYLQNKTNTHSSRYSAENRCNLNEWMNKLYLYCMFNGRKKYIPNTYEYMDERAVSVSMNKL